MQEGLRQFINYTNTWKNYLDEEKERFSGKAGEEDIENLFDNLQKGEITGYKMVKVRGSDYEEARTELSLPVPLAKERLEVTISFRKNKQQAEALMLALYGTKSGIKFGELGSKCFDLIYKEKGLK